MHGTHEIITRYWRATNTWSSHSTFKFTFIHIPTGNVHACDCILHACVAALIYTSILALIDLEDVKEDSVYELELRPDDKKVQA